MVERRPVEGNLAALLDCQARCHDAFPERSGNVSSRHAAATAREGAREIVSSLRVGRGNAFYALREKAYRETKSPAEAGLFLGCYVSTPFNMTIVFIKIYLRKMELKRLAHIARADNVHVQNTLDIDINTFGAI